MQIGQIYGTENEPNPMAGRVYSDEGLSPCLSSMMGGHRQPQMIVKDENGVLLDDGRMVRIRRLTPKECFRLQGWSDDYFEKAQFVNSDSQLYKQAGNGVTVNVIYAIGKELEDST